MSTVLRRNRPGTTRNRLYDWEPYDSISSIEGPFANQEYLQQLVRQFQKKNVKKRVKTSSLEKMIRVPPNATSSVDSNEGDESDESERYAWIYEQFRQFLLELNEYVLSFRDVCTAETHPKMAIPNNIRRELGDPTLTEEDHDDDSVEFFCAAFDEPTNVPAMDYIIHSINHATQELSDAKTFPNRNSISKKGMREIKTHARRIYRIFAFAYFMFNSLFYELERETRLCERYTVFCSRYKLMSSRLFMIPSSAFGDSDGSERKKKKKSKRSSKK